MRGARPPVAQTVNWSEELRKLDAGAYRAAVVKFASDRVDDDPAHRVWRAEVLCYLDRLEDARAELEAAPIPPELAARAALVEAETLLWEGAPDACERRARDVAEAVNATDADLARALAMIARASVRRGEYAVAVGRIAIARPLVRAVGLEHLAAVLDNAEGYARSKTARDETIGEVFERAVAAFRQMRDPRWEAITRTTCGGWLDEMGRTSEAIAELEGALAIASRNGFEREAIWARHNLAQVHLAMGDLDGATEVLAALMDETRAARHGTTEAHGLVSLAFAYLLQGRRLEAARAAGSASAVAEMAGAEMARVEAEILAAYLRAREGERDGIADLRRFRVAAPAAAQCYRATLYLVDVLAPEDPAEAMELWREAEAMAEAGERSTFAGLRPYVERRLRAYPVRVDERGRFVVDLAGRNFPLRRAAHDALDRYLIAAALRSSETHLGAARLLGETKGNFSKLVRRYAPALAMAAGACVGL
jgi:tetratricopeptide (TPR) repeat protein